MLTHRYFPCASLSLQALFPHTCTYTLICSHRKPFCHPISLPSTISQFARDLNAVKNGLSFLIAFDNNFVKAPLAAGEEQSHQQL